LAEVRSKATGLVGNGVAFPMSDPFACNFLSPSVLVKTDPELFLTAVVLDIVTGHQLQDTAPPINGGLPTMHPIRNTWHYNLSLPSYPLPPISSTTGSMRKKLCEKP